MSRELIEYMQALDETMEAPLSDKQMLEECYRIFVPPKRKSKFIFGWHAFWIGAIWDKENKDLYIFPVPFCGLKISFD